VQVTVIARVQVRAREDLRSVALMSREEAAGVIHRQASARGT
jgi:hypothetical protein